MTERKNALMSKESVINNLKDIKLFFNKTLNHFTYTRTGGPVDVLAFPKTKEDVVTIMVYCRENSLPWKVLGNASNVIINDGGINGIVIMTNEINAINIEDNKVIAEAGAKLIDVSYKALENDLTGLEFACGIPGSIGGAVYMNAGAYGGEIKDVLSSVDVIFPDGTMKVMTNEELKFSYRKSVVEEINCVVLKAVFELKKGNHEEIKRKIDELTELRVSKQPLEYPSCGSVFKRPKGYFAGKLIQDAGLQGFKIGGVQVSTKHAGFMVNVDEGTATDYVELIEHVQNVVQEKFDVDLETEILASISLSSCQKDDAIIRNDFDGPNADGSYRWAIQTEGGIYHEQRGSLQPGSSGEPALVVEGQYQYTAPDGQVIHLLYEADENGFRPTGDHLPTPPPVPPAIQRALDYLATKPPPTDNDY